MKYLISTVLLLAMQLMPVAQQNVKTESTLAFLIGENEAQYERLVAEHNVQLLNVCDNSMDKAYNFWTALLVDLESYAEEQDFDLKGTKIWINVFWNADGTIRNIVYYPKPNSKNMDFELLSDFLSDFASSYQYELQHDKPFSHYGSAAFPTISSIAQNK